MHAWGTYHQRRAGGHSTGGSRCPQGGATGWSWILMSRRCRSEFRALAIHPGVVARRAGGGCSAVPCRRVIAAGNKCGHRNSMFITYKNGIYLLVNTRKKPITIQNLTRTKATIDVVWPHFWWDPARRHSVVGLQHDGGRGSRGCDCSRIGELMRKSEEGCGVWKICKKNFFQ